MDFSLFNVTLHKTLNEVMKISRLLSLLLFLCLSLQLSFSATDNPEAPNLNFSHDNFDGWKRYYGEFYAVDQSGVAYEYKWTEQSNTGERIKIINTVDEQDPIVACSNLYTNPFDGSLVARIGEPLKTEGMTDSSKPCPDRWQKQRPAAAEKLSYTYIVGPNSNILNYNFATVLQIPVKSGSPHFGDEFPYFGIQIEVKNPTTGAYYQVPCGAYNTIANETSNTLLSNLTYDKCPASSAKQASGDYLYRPWTAGTIDLRKYEGYEVTISVITHDCIVECTGYPVAGGHEAYGYFRAEATTLELTSVSCGVGDAMIIAPEGYPEYKWSRSDGRNSDGIVIAEPNRITIPRATMVNGIEYKCEISDELGCANIDLTTLLDPVDVVSNFGYTNKCFGEVVFDNISTINGDEIDSYSWDFSDGGYSTEENPVHVFDSPKDYNVSLTTVSKKGCSHTVTKQVSVRYFPKLVISELDPICKDKTFTLDVEGAEDGSSFRWYTDAEDNISTNSHLTTSASETTLYYVEATDLHGCVYNAQKTVVVKTPPVVSIDGPEQVCSGSTVILSASGANNFKWIGTEETGSNIVVTPATEQTYKVIGTDNFGCIAEAEHTVKVHPRPEVNVVGDEVICDGSSTKWLLSGAETYFWNDGSNDIERTISKEGTYTIKGVDANGCESLPLTKTLIASQSPVIEYSGITAACVGDEYMVNLTSDIVGTEYLWLDDNTTGNRKNIPVESDLILNVQGTSPLGCASVAKIELKAIPTPIVYISGPKSICASSEEPITLAVNTSETTSNLWNTGENTTEIDVKPNVNTTYSVEAVSANGCKGVATYDVSILPTPNVKVELADYSICPGEENAKLELTAYGAVSYKWSSDLGSEDISNNLSSTLKTEVTLPISIKVQGTDDNGCFAENAIEIKDLPAPIFAYNVEPNFIEEGRNEVRVSGLEPNKDATWYWDFGDGTSVDASKNTTHSYDISHLSDSYTVSITAIDKHDCVFKAEVPIYIWREVWAPDAFTPNGDGLNDEFKFFVSELITDFKFYIYDRIGNIVFEGNSAEDSWDGYFNGKLCPWGVYGWVVDYKAEMEGVEKIGSSRGMVSIIR
jgi:gliding motility-associated-like protein